ncbi:MAG: hypothetical protein NVS1B14_09110 [Vulcanimicrobiaceae bacterium]
MSQDLHVLQARDHLEMVDRILARADETKNCVPYQPFLIWGVAAAVINLVNELVYVQHVSDRLFFLAGAAIVVALLLTMVYVRQLQGQERRSLIGRQVYYAFNIAWILAAACDLLAFRIFPQWGQAAIWSVMYGAAMLFAGTLVRSRVLLAGGIVLIASIAAANFAVGFAGYILAAGDLIGLAGAGLVLYASQR